jgi:hypothetical protein
MPAFPAALREHSARSAKKKEAGSACAGHGPLRQHEEEEVKRKAAATMLAAVGCAWATATSATDGYFQHGYGLIAKGMGGVSTALALDAFGGATNPAKMVFAGDRIDIGVDLFSPQRSALRTGSLTVSA